MRILIFILVLIIILYCLCKVLLRQCCNLYVNDSTFTHAHNLDVNGHMFTRAHNLDVNGHMFTRAHNLDVNDHTFTRAHDLDGGLMLPFTHGNEIGTCLTASALQSICNSHSLANMCVQKSLDFDNHKPLTLTEITIINDWIYQADKLPSAPFIPIMCALIGRYIEFELLFPHADSVWNEKEYLQKYPDKYYYSQHDVISSRLIGVIQGYASRDMKKLSSYLNIKMSSYEMPGFDLTKIFFTKINCEIEHTRSDIIPRYILSNIQRTDFFVDTSAGILYTKKGDILFINDEFLCETRVAVSQFSRQLINVAFYSKSNDAWYLPTDLMITTGYNDEWGHMCYYDLFSNILEDNYKHIYLPIEELCYGATGNQAVRLLMQQPTVNSGFLWSKDNVHTLRRLIITNIHFQKFSGITQDEITDAHYYIINIDEKYHENPYKDIPWRSTPLQKGKYKSDKRKLYLRLLLQQVHFPSPNYLYSRYVKNIGQVLQNKGKYSINEKLIRSDAVVLPITGTNHYPSIEKYGHLYRVEKGKMIIHDIVKQEGDVYIDTYNGRRIKPNEVPPLSVYPPFMINRDGNKVCVCGPWNEYDTFRNIEHWIKDGNTLKYNPENCIPVMIEDGDNIWE